MRKLTALLGIVALYIGAATQANATPNALVCVAFASFCHGSAPEDSGGDVPRPPRVHAPDDAGGDVPKPPHGYAPDGSGGEVPRPPR